MSACRAVVWPGVQKKRVFYMQLSFQDAAATGSGRQLSPGTWAGVGAAFSRTSSMLATSGSVLGATGGVAGASSSAPPPQQWLVLSVHGVERPARGFEHGLRELLHNTLNGMTLDFLTAVLVRNPKFKLTPGDVAFLRPPGAKSQRRQGFLLPPGVRDPVHMALLLEQNVQLYLHRLNFTTNTHRAADVFGGGGGARKAAPNGGGGGHDGDELPAEVAAARDSCVACLPFVFKHGPTRRPMAAAVIKQVGRGIALVQVSVHRVGNVPRAAQTTKGASALCV